MHSAGWDRTWHGCGEGGGRRRGGVGRDRGGGERSPRRPGVDVFASRRQAPTFGAWEMAAFSAASASTAASTTAANAAAAAVAAAASLAAASALDVASTAFTTAASASAALAEAAACSAATVVAAKISSRLRPGSGCFRTGSPVSPVAGLSFTSS